MTKNDVFCQAPTLEEAAQNACDRLGVVWKQTPHDGRWHRLDVDAKNGRNDGSITYFQDGQGGIAWNHQTGESYSFFVADQAFGSLSEAEKTERKRKFDEQRKQSEAELAKNQREAAQLANKIWLISSVVDAHHSYFAKKGVKNTQYIKELSIEKVTGLLKYTPSIDSKPLSGRILIIPLKDINDDETTSIQFIDENGTKYFLPNGKKRGCFFEIPKNNSTIYICEGVATALSISEAFPEQTVIVAFDAINLQAVAKEIRGKHPNANIVLCCDDDWRRTNKTTGKPENIGKIKGLEAARAVNGKVATPDFGNAERPEKATDFNDLHQLCGVEAVRRCVGEASSSTADEAQANAQSPANPKKSMADSLVEISGTAELFHTQNDEAFADVQINGHRETYAVRSKQFKKWLLSKLFEETGKAANSDAISNALQTIEAKASFSGELREVFVRVAEFDGKFYIDLANDAWQAIEIDLNGWRIVDGPPVRFRRPSGMLPMPTPVTGGNINDLRDFLNVRSDNDFALVVSWLVAAMSPRGPYPVLAATGEQGTAKSTFCELLRSIVDPNDTPLRSIPRSDHDLFIAANNSQVIAIDNVSGLPNWLSDSLCRLATGGGFSVRQLYSDGEEIRFTAKRPIILNGIEDIATRGDLADRAIAITLKPINEADRKLSQNVMADFKAKLPVIHGALLDGISYGLKNWQNVQLKSLPRMADFAFWACACEARFWPRGTFSMAYEVNRGEAIGTLLDGDAVVASIRSLLDERRDGRWLGSASDLLGRLRALTPPETIRERTFPANARALSNCITRLAPALRKIGIEICFTRTAQSKLIEIKKISVSDDGDAVNDANMTQNDANMTQNDAKPNVEKPLHTNENDANDANDANFHTLRKGTQKTDNAAQSEKCFTDEERTRHKPMRLKIPRDDISEVLF